MVYEKFCLAFRRGCPIVSFETADPAESLQEMRKALDAEFAGDASKQVGIVIWDCAQGLSVLAGDVVAKDALARLSDPAEYAGSPMAVLADAAKVGERCIVVLQNAHRFIDDISIVQAIWNCRDRFKASRNMLVLMSPGMSMPIELQHDVIALVEPLPNAEQLAGVLRRLHDSVGCNATDEQLTAAASAALGVTAFAAENLAALSMNKESGVSVDGLWESKKKKINETPALSVVSGGSFSAIGGVSQIKKFMHGILHGKAKPNAIVYVDEIEKQLGGATTDSSGVGQDQLGQLLSNMQDRRATGAILVGPPGAAKSAFAKAAGGEAGIPTIQLDLGGAKGSLVGQSETLIRDALKVIDAVSGGKTLWLVTCNSLANLPPELKRRFKLGTWFFDLPDAEERKAIWEIYAQRFALDESDYAALLSKQWTGAEIESCCELSWQLGVSCVEASQYIVPVATQAAESIAQLQSGADNRFLSASYPGTYKRNGNAAERAIGRSFE